MCPFLRCFAGSRDSPSTECGIVIPLNLGLLQKQSNCSGQWSQLQDQNRENRMWYSDSFKSGVVTETIKLQWGHLQDQNREKGHYHLSD
jgi:hypothetical protein